MTKGRNASGSVVPRPDVLKQRRKPRTTSTGPQDTPLADANEVTHKPGDLPSALAQHLGPLLAQPHAHAAAGAAAQQQRQYHAAAAAAVLRGGLGGGSSLAAVAARLLGGGRRQPLGSSWRGFAASCW